MDAAGVTRPLPKDGVTLPLDIEGVFRPLPREVIAEGVILPDAEKDGVMRPLRTDATEDGLDIPAVAADNLVDATKTPQLGGQVKYCLLRIVDISIAHTRKQSRRMMTALHCDPLDGQRVAINIYTIGHVGACPPGWAALSVLQSTAHISSPTKTCHEHSAATVCTEIGRAHV